MLFTACNKEDSGSNGTLKSAESYEVKIRGSHPDGAIDSEFIVEADESINNDKIVITKTNNNGSTIAIRINLPITETFSGGKESIGFSVSNLDKTDIWNLEDFYQTYHVTLNSQHRKKSIIDYTIHKNNFYYGSLNRFDKGGITLKRQGDLLIGNFSARLDSDFGDGTVNISGSFEANLNDDDLD